MSVSNRKLIESFHFQTLEELRHFLNNFHETDLTTVFPAGFDHFRLDWFEETLSDGESTVNDCLLTVV